MIRRDVSLVRWSQNRTDQVGMLEYLDSRESAKYTISLRDATFLVGRRTGWKQGSQWSDHGPWTISPLFRFLVIFRVWWTTFSVSI